MFGRKAHAAHIEFLQRQLKVLDEALKPRHRPITPRDFQVTRSTGVTVTFTNEEPRT
jgi:hypothetical protein